MCRESVEKCDILETMKKKLAAVPKWLKRPVDTTYLKLFRKLIKKTSNKQL